MMTVTTHLRQLLAERRIVLWVEDSISKVYLETIWQSEDSLFQILVAGGSHAVSAVVHDLRGNGYGHVFGLADRDFGNGNVASWRNPASNIEVFRPSCHELENFLLDWPALEGCRENRRLSRTVAQIETRARNYAQTMIWWMACRNVLADYWRRLVGAFPTHPKVQEVADQASAQQYVLKKHDWWASLPSSTGHIQDQAHVLEDLDKARTTHAKQVDDGTWIAEFSGKEVFRDLRGYLFNETYASGEAMDCDLAKSVGQWQFANNKVPQDMLALKEVLIARSLKP